ncbi:AAA family ATPase [Rubrobacter marinus]|uniref:DNA 5'-3' helicase n=1 Tax=Rubrobacter marinus TaxID=2653852 RepID=A0A6G8PZK7_9ACTN|nr:DnaB-like helicase C-terminal domain-containing protein [Rubrobacter marinus]QIN79625.1 AAA family ATPase [Rubrobacter marinus]
MTGRVSAAGEPAFDLDAERAVLGACLVSNAALSRLVGELEAEDFWREGHRVLWEAIRAAAREHDEIDHLLVAEKLPKGKDYRGALFSLIESVPTAVNAFRYAEIVLSASRARRALAAADRLKEACLSGEPETYESAPERAMAELEGVVRRDPKGGARAIAEGVDDLVAWLDEAREHGGVTGLRTGIPKLDRAVKGLNPGRLYLVAGRPGAGKSLLCAQIAATVARQGKRVLLQSPEMGLEDYLRRLATASAGVSGERVEEGKITHEEAKRIVREATKLAGCALYVDDRGTQTVADVRRNVLRYEPDLLVVDYLQRLMPEPEAREASSYEQVSRISFDLDRIKKDFGIPVVAAAQLSRANEQRGGKHKRPILSDLRASGQIEQDADVVAMLFRTSHYEDAPEDELEIALEKNRHGSLFEATLYLDAGLWISDGRRFSA